MTPVDLLKSLSGPASFAGAPFGADLITFCRALEARGGVGLYVARDDKSANTARRLAQFISPRLDCVDLPGWDTLLEMMRPGDRWMLYIPSDLGYGEMGTPGGPIPPNAPLIFEVEMMDVMKRG